MQVARSSMVAGVAILSAGALAFAPVAPPPPPAGSPAPAVYSVETQLTASFSEVFDTSGEYAQLLVEQFTDNPAPILTQVLANQKASLDRITAVLPDVADGLGAALTDGIPAVFESAITKLTDGNVEGAVNDLLSLPVVLAVPLLGLIEPIRANVLQSVDALKAATEQLFDLNGLAAVLYAAGGTTWLLSAAAAPVAGVQGVLTALGTGDPEAILNAVADLPATALDGLLNGGYGPNLGEALIPGLDIYGGGLLTPTDPDIGFGVPSPNGITFGGPLQTVLNLRSYLAGAIGTVTGVSARAMLTTGSSDALPETASVPDVAPALEPESEPQMQVSRSAVEPGDLTEVAGKNSEPAEQNVGEIRAKAVQRVALREAAVQSGTDEDSGAPESDTAVGQQSVKQQLATAAESEAADDVAPAAEVTRKRSPVRELRTGVRDGVSKINGGIRDGVNNFRTGIRDAVKDVAKPFRGKSGNSSQKSDNNGSSSTTD